MRPPDKNEINRYMLVHTTSDHNIDWTISPAFHEGVAKDLIYINRFKIAESSFIS